MNMNRVGLALCLTLAVFLALPAQASNDFTSLAAEIHEANRVGSGTITLDSDTTLSEALPPITGTITIEGSGRTISGASEFRIFNVNGGNLTIRNLTLTNGNGGLDAGGAIRVGRNARLLVERVAFYRNAAKVGGAIGARGRYNSLRVANSSFQGNSAEQGGAISLGIDQATIESSSFWQNLATTSGGAIAAFRGEIAIRNSAFFLNIAGAGGGIHNTRADVRMTHVTMLENVASDPEGASLRGVRGRINLYNSVIAGGSEAALCAGRIGENAGNLIEDWSCNAEYGGDPMLDRVEASIPYFAPQDDSPAINAAYQRFCLARDQIGKARPHGGGCDIGAIEATSTSAASKAVAGVCTLYDRIIAANSNRAAGACPAGSTHDIITITEDIALRLPLPPITGTITIEGGGHSISGDGKFRVFTVNGGNLTLNDLTLKDGKTEDGGGAIHVRNGGWLTVNGSTFIGNSAGLSGGAIDLTGATRGVSNDPKISNLTHYSQGSGLTVTDSSFISNRSGSGGGALSLYGATKISKSSFSANEAGRSGGAISGYGGSADISNSTFSQNRAKFSGGAITGANLTLTHLTMVDNTSPGVEGSGRALDVGRNVSLRNSVISGGRQGQPLCMGWLFGNNANLIEDGSCSALISGTAGLGELTGWPAHHPPLDGSPAIDAADPAYCPPTDQTGNSRPQGWRCDIGAIESSAANAVRPDSFESEGLDSAQVEKADLDCRVTTTHDLNLREDPSLNGKRVGRVRQGETLAVIEQSASWLSVNYRGTEGWISAYYVDAQGDCGFPPQAQSPISARATGSMSSQIDNCCNNGWNCVDDRDWSNGQWAFANDHCEQRATHDGRRDDAPSCCHHGWFCAFDFDWTLGRMQVSVLGVEACGSPIQESLEGVIIEGPPWFIKHTKEALAMMKTSAPEWYAYTIEGPLKIRYWEGLSSHSMGRSIILGSIFDYKDLGFTAAMIVHETCHVQRWLHHVWRDDELENQAEEAVCDSVAINALDQFASGARYERNRIDEFLTLGLDFDLDAAANREWARAKLILARRQS